MTRRMQRTAVLTRLPQPCRTRTLTGFRPYNTPKMMRMSTNPESQGKGCRPSHTAGGCLYLCLAATQAAILRAGMHLHGEGADNHLAAAEAEQLVGLRALRLQGSAAIR